MRRTQANLANSLKRNSQNSRVLVSERLSADDYLRNRSNMSHHQGVPNMEEDDCDDDDGEDVNRGRKEAEHTPLLNKTH